MSDGPKKNSPHDTTPTFITMDPEEFNRVCKRLNQMLTSRVEKAWEKKQRKPTKKTSNNHIEATKDAFAFIHLMELVEHMSEEIYGLRMELQTLGTDDDDDIGPSWMAPPGSKKNFMN